MKKLAVAIFALSTLGFSAFSSAEKNTFSLGYAQSKVQDFKDIKGINVKYRYEWDSPVSIITSFTYMSGKENSSYKATKDIMNANTKVKYYSFSAGPAYRFNDYISAYSLIGVNYNKIKNNTSWNNYEGENNYVYMGDFSSKQNKASLMYGIGLQINPVEYLAVDIGYEGSRVKVDNTNHSINGFNIGVGYSF